MDCLRFKLTCSRRLCYRGHTDTYEIEGADEKSQAWLTSWTLYCHTCKALTTDFAHFMAAQRQPRAEGVIGFVTQVPIHMKITKGSNQK